MKQKNVARGMKVTVYDRYRFAIPVHGTVIGLAEGNDGVMVQLETTNSPQYPIGSEIWVHAQQVKRKCP